MKVSTYYDQMRFENYKYPIVTNFNVKLAVEERPLRESRFGWHEEIEIKRFINGGSKLYIDGETFKVEDGEVVIVNPYEAHYTYFAPEESEYDVIIFNVKFFKSIFDSLFSSYGDKNRFVPFIEGRLKFNRHIKNPEILVVVETLFSELRTERTHSEMAVISLILYLFSLLFDSEINRVEDEPIQKKMNEFKKIEPALVYMGDNFDKQDISLELLAGICGFNPAYFSRLFKTVMDTGVYDYLTGLRLRRAEILLLSTDKKIREIAGLVGFLDESYFGRWFKKKSGITPAQYRLNNGEA